MRSVPHRAGGAIPRLFFCAVLGCLWLAHVPSAFAGSATWLLDSWDEPQQIIGMASWYGPGFSGRRTASGERFDPHGMTAAHRTLPLGSKVRVTNLRNGRSVELRITDRGPFRRRRVLDLSLGAARVLGIVNRGVDRVLIEPL